MSFNNIFDAHAHYDDAKFDGDRFELIESLPSKGVCGIVNNSVDLETSKISISYAEKYDFMYAAVGYHPENLDNMPDDYLSRLAKLCEHKKVAAIGEIGLDYHYTKENKEIQKRCFITQLEIAKMLDLPVVVHDREAHFDTLEILKQSKVERVLLHCFSGSTEFMKQCCNLGYKIALGGVVTFKNAIEPKEVAREVDMKDLMLETDSPFLTPHPFRGMENSPKYIGFVAKEIAKIKNIPYDSIVFETSKNAKEFFNITEE